MTTVQIYQRNYDKNASDPEGYTLQPFEYDVILPLYRARHLLEAIDALALVDSLSILETDRADRFFKVDPDEGLCVVLRGRYMPIKEHEQVYARWNLSAIEIQIEQQQEALEHLWAKQERVAMMIRENTP